MPASSWSSSTPNKRQQNGEGHQQRRRRRRRRWHRRRSGICLSGVVLVSRCLDWFPYALFASLDLVAAVVSVGVACDSSKGEMVVGRGGGRGGGGEEADSDRRIVEVLRLALATVSLGRLAYRTIRGLQFAADLHAAAFLDRLLRLGASGGGAGVAATAAGLAAAAYPYGSGGSRTSLLVSAAARPEDVDDDNDDDEVAAATITAPSLTLLRSSSPSLSSCSSFSSLGMTATAPLVPENKTTRTTTSSTSATTAATVFAGDGAAAASRRRRRRRRHKSSECRVERSTVAFLVFETLATSLLFAVLVVAASDLSTDAAEAHGCRALLALATVSVLAVVVRYASYAVAFCDAEGERRR